MVKKEKCDVCGRRISSRLLIGHMMKAHFTDKKGFFIFPHKQAMLQYVKELKEKKRLQAEAMKINVVLKTSKGKSIAPSKKKIDKISRVECRYCGAMITESRIKGHIERVHSKKDALDYAIFSHFESNRRRH